MVPVIPRFKTWVCGRSLAGITGLNPAGDIIIIIIIFIYCTTATNHIQQNQNTPNAVIGILFS